MPKLTPTIENVTETSREIALNRQMHLLPNPFASDNPDVLISAERVIDFLGRIHAESGGIDKEIIEANSYTEEFMIGVPTIEAVETEINLVESIELHALKEISDEQLKAAAVEFVDAHTVIWRKNLFGKLGETAEPYNKRGEYTEWTKFIDLYHLTFYSEHHRVNNGTFNLVQGWIADALWQRGDLLNNTEWRRL